MDDKNLPSADYLTPKEAAAILGVSPITIRQWAQKNDLPSFTTQGGHRRFRKEDIEDFSLNIESKIKRVKQTLRVLIVDDDREFSNYLTDILSSLSPLIKSKKAADGFVAGKELFIYRPHIVLLDIRMPNLSGIQVCKSTKLDPSTEHTRVIAMTGYSEPAEVEAVIAAGAECCLSKPIFKKELLQALNLSKYPTIFPELIT